MSQSQAVDLMVVHASEVLTCRASRAHRGVRGADLERVETVRDGAVAIHEGRIVAVGDTEELRRRYAPDSVIDACGRLVTPGLIDAHTHLVHGGSRHEEFDRRLRALPPDASREGIASTVTATTALPDAQLLQDLQNRLDVMLQHGTTTAEVKTGYGIYPEEERRLLRVLASVRHPVVTVPTFLGAHMIPPELVEDRAGALALVIDQLPQVRDDVAYVDVCCDPGGFSPQEVRDIAAAAREFDLGMRVHGDHAAWAGGGEIAVEIGAASVDHLEHLSDEAILRLAESDTVAVLCPGVTLHLRHLVSTRGPEGERPALHPDLGGRFRALARSGAVVALATDYNPGTAPTLSMQMVMQLASRLYGFSAAQVWQMCTVNAAVSLDRDDQIGSLEPGYRADLVIWSVSDHRMVIDRFGSNLVQTVLSEGQICYDSRAAAAATRTPGTPQLTGVSR